MVVLYVSVIGAQDGPAAGERGDERLPQIAAAIEELADVRSSRRVAQEAENARCKGKYNGLGELRRPILSENEIAVRSGNVTERNSRRSECLGTSDKGLR